MVHTGGKRGWPTTVSAEGCGWAGWSCLDSEELVYDGSHMASVVLNFVETDNVSSSFSIVNFLCTYEWKLLLVDIWFIVIRRYLNGSISTSLFNLLSIGRSHCYDNSKKNKARIRWAIEKPLWKKIIIFILFSFLFFWFTLMNK